MKITNILKDHKLWILILLSFLIRTIYINSFPPALNWDEVSHGYNAYSILNTGKDEWGVNFPTIFRAYGDYKLPVYIYLTTISELLFGLNAFAVRFVSVLAGVGIVIFGYLLGKKLWNEKSRFIDCFFNYFRTLVFFLVSRSF